MLTAPLAIFDTLSRCLRAEPELATRLGRAQALPAAAPGIAPIVQQLCPGAGLAALRCYGEQGIRPLGACIAADPAYLRAEARGVRVMALGELALSAAEVAELQAQLSAPLRDYGMRLYTPDPARWYLQPEADYPELLSEEPALLLGAQLLGALPQAPFWQRLFNDVQIELAQLPSQQARAQRGLLPVNGLWFWGSGVLPEHPGLSVRCTSQDPLLRGLALATSQPQESRMRPELELFDLRGDTGKWRELPGTVHCWFVSGERWLLRPGQAWKFWRKPVLAS